MNPSLRYRLPVALGLSALLCAPAFAADPLTVTVHRLSLDAAERIAQGAKDLGLQRVILTPPADQGLLAGLCAYNWAQ